MKRFFRNFQGAKYAAGFLLILGSLALLAPSLSPTFLANPYVQDSSQILKSPGQSNYLGTDLLGRDLASRLIYGARISLFIGIVSAIIAALLGAFLGAISAYAGGWLDHLIMRGVDLWYAFPALLLIVLVKELIEQGDPKRGLWAILIALSLYSWMHVARIVRGEILKLREMPYFEAARALGASHGRLIFRHLLPNTWGPLLVTLTMRIPLAILAESMLGFVGLGVKSPLASWGTLASEGWTAMRFHPHLIFFPSLFLFITILAFNVLGEALREHLDPQAVGTN